MKRFLLPALLALVAVLLVGTGFELAPRVAHAQTSAPDVFAVFSGTSLANTAPALVIAGKSGQRIRIKDVVGGVVTAGPIGLYDGATYTTNVGVLVTPANTLGELTNQFFMGGNNTVAGKVLTSGNGLYVAAPNGGAIYLNVRYEQD